MQKFNLLEWIRKYDAGNFSNPDVIVQIDAGWHDWFCRDTSLVSKTKSLSSKVKKVASSTKVNKLGLENVYVFFKNCCPLSGRLYDQFSICDAKSGDVHYCIVPRHVQRNNEVKSELWGTENAFDKPLVIGTFKDVLSYLNA